MFSASLNPFATQAHQALSHSKERQPNNFEGGYGCVVYQDYLVLLGTTREAAERGESIICAYNLKEKRPEEIERERIPIAVGSCTACFFPNLPGVMFYGKIESSIGRIPMDSPSHTCTLASFVVQRGGRNHFRGHLEHCQKNACNDRLQVALGKASSGPGSALSVCHFNEEGLYVYDPSVKNANLGSVHMLSVRGNTWATFGVNTGNLKLNEPSRHALFINDVLYIFAANVDFPSQTVETGHSVIEDIYILDLKKNQNGGTWERISPPGRVPGVMTHISLTETNGMIYVFGLSQGKSVLWTYNVSEQEWKQVRYLDTLTARPDQKAVIYEGQLLIVDWGYSRDSVQIQYLSLDDLNFATPNEKDLCKDETENFIQDVKNLFNGKSFPDAILEVEGEEIPAHKAILAYRSDYFMKMFTSGMSESHSVKISIPNMKSHIFKALLQYIYCNEVELDERLALGLIPVVDEYLMKGLKGLCEKYLCKQLRKNNVVDMLIMADRHEIEELKKACFRFILKNLDNIDENEEMMKLSKSLFFELLKFQTLGGQQNNSKSQPKEEEQESSFVSVSKQPDFQQKYAFRKAAIDALSGKMRELQPE